MRSTSRPATTAVSQPAIFVASLAALESLRQTDAAALDSCSATAGLSQTVSGTATDRAGNSASVRSELFSIVFAKPTIVVAVSPPANANPSLARLQSFKNQK